MKLLQALILPGLLSCGPRKPPEAPPACALTLDGLAGTEWVHHRLVPSGERIPDPRARLRFRASGAGLEAQYSAGSLSDVYTYRCRLDGDALACETPLEPERWCMAALAAGEACTLDLFSALAPALTEAQLAPARAAAEAAFADRPDDARLRLAHNNLGNKLQGLLYVRVDAGRCGLQVTDMYRTLYNGNRLEDSNPVGTDRFVANPLGPLRWRSCTSLQELVALRSADAEPVRRVSAGEEVHYRLLSPAWERAEEGYTYRYDLWRDAVLVAEDLEPAVAEGRVVWSFTETFSEPSGQPVVSTIAARRVRGEQREELVACSALVVE